MNRNYLPLALLCAFVGLVVGMGGCKEKKWRVRMDQKESTAARHAIGEVQALKERVRKGQAEVTGLLSSKGALPKQHPAALRSRRTMKTATAWITSVQKSVVGKLEHLVDDANDNEKNEQKVASLRKSLEAQLVHHKKEVGGALQSVRAQSKALAGMPELTTKTSAAVKEAEAQPEKTLSEAVATAAKLHPGAGKTLNRELTELTERVASLQKSQATLSRSRQTKLPDYVKIATAVGRLRADAQDVMTRAVRLGGRAAGLDQMQDLILVDYDVRGGQHYHRYIRITDKTAQADSHWTPVSAKTFTSHQDYVGMCVVHKPRGTLMEDATRHPTAPGFHYIGNPRYGAFQPVKGGRKRWVFNAEHATMNQLLWGKYHSQIGIYEANYQAYLRLKKQHKVWYGVDDRNRPVFGTHGVMTLLLYHKYVAARARRRADRTKRGIDKMTAKLKKQRDQTSDAGVYAPGSTAGSSDPHSPSRSYGGFRTGSGRVGGYSGSSYGGSGK